MLGWFVITAVVTAGVTIVYMVGGDVSLAGYKIFGLTFFPDGTNESTAQLSAVVFGLGVLFFGLLQGLVNWLLVSCGLIVAGLFTGRKGSANKLLQRPRSVAGS